MKTKKQFMIKFFLHFFCITNLLLFSFNPFVFGNDLSPYKESLLPYNKNLSPYKQSLSPYNKNLSPYKESLSPYNNDLSPYKKDLSVYKSNDNAIGHLSIAVESSTIDPNINPIENNVIDHIEDQYINGYGKFIASVAPEHRDKFVQYFYEWHRTGSRADFFSYAHNRSETEKRLQYCYDSTLKKFGIGTGIVATVWVVSFIAPGGAVFQVSVLVLAKATTTGATVGALSGGVISAGISYIHGDRGKELLYKTIDGAADGYLIGAITGFAEGAAEAVSWAKNSTVMDGIVTNAKNNKHALFSNGRIITDEKEIAKIIKKDWKTMKNFKYDPSINEAAYKKLCLHKSCWGKKKPSKVLKENFTKYYNVEIPKYAQAHHIVPESVKGEFGSKLRDILKKYKIDINDPHNCVILPKDDLRANILKMAQHKGSTGVLHGDKIYQNLYEELGRADSREKVFEVLSDYATKMQKNELDWLK